MTFETKKAKHFLPACIGSVLTITSTIVFEFKTLVSHITAKRLAHKTTHPRNSSCTNMGRENCVFLALVYVYLELGALVSGALIYPSVQWSFQNPR